jgi:glycosyltransferase involved in cell wall biosynthesis
MPRVSVIMNCYNGEKYLREAIDSVYRQSYPDWEIIFWDNQSTDSSAQIAKSYDARVKYFRSDAHTTLGAARKLAVHRAAGDWLAFLDCDDVWYPEKLTQQMQVVVNTDYVLSYGGIVEIDGAGRKIRKVLPKHQSGQQLESQLLQFEIHLVTALVSKAALEKYGLAFDDHVTASEEYNLFLRMCAKGPVSVVHRLLASYRILTTSLSTRNMSKLAHERKYTLEQLKMENPGVELALADAFREATARGDYYDARFRYSTGDSRSARNVMRSISGYGYKYRLLYLALFVPYLWDLIHSNLVKRVILPKLLRIVG